MKTKIPLIFGLVFVLLMNTSGLWNRLPGLWDLSISLLLFASFIAIIVSFIIALIKVVRSNDVSRQLRINLFSLGVVILLTVIFPSGISKHRMFRGPILFSAQAKGAANCTSTITLKPEGKFIYISACLGVDEIRGEYLIEDDTIKFYADNRGENICSYGFIEKESAIDTLEIFKYYSNIEDSIPSYYEIIHNEIIGKGPL